MSRAAAEIEPVSRMLSSNSALPGPMRAPDSKTMLILTRGMPGTVPSELVRSRPIFQPSRAHVVTPGVRGIKLFERFTDHAISAEKEIVSGEFC